MKITNPNFVFPQVLAESKVKTLETGATKPIVIMGRDKKLYTLTTCVAKPIRFNRMSEIASLSELCASFIASELDLKVPSPVIVEITEDFCELYRGEETFQSLHNSIGLNFGTVYMEGWTTWNNDVHLLQKFHKNLLNIFIFDMFIENGDRRPDKPNMFTNREEIYIYDHETSFSFLHMFSSALNPAPWKLNSGDMYTADNHILFPYLKNKDFVSEDFFEKFDNLNTEFWSKAESLIPDAWRCDNFEKIKNYLSLKVINADKYKDEIRRLLS
ncbi:MAG TPA: HipA family kinase [Ignavibacteriales bacterium]|nr:HipA family kinase [Ignavibacteriales bacterium]